MTERSFWGWGLAERFPDEDARRGLAQQLTAVLGVPVGEPRPAPRLDDARLPPSRVAVPDALADVVTADREARIRHTYGRSYADLVRGFSGDFSPAPDLVAFARTEQDVVDVVTWASAHGVAVVPFGGGTSVVGGVEPDVGPGFAGTLSLDLCGLDRVLEVDTTSHAARIQAGALGPGIEAQLAPHGLTLRHYPQSFEFSTLGGWLATRSGGHFATLTTHIDDFVESLRVVTPAGLVASRRLPASGAGPSPDRMWLGSEGTLGVITEAWMRVRPRPRWRSTANVKFSDWRQSVDAVRALAQSGLHPSNCRLLDAREALLHGVSFDGTHVLILGFESADHATQPAMERAVALALAHGGACPAGPKHRDEGERTGDVGEAGAWRQAFFDGPYLQTALVSLGVVVDTFETAITWDRFEALHTDVVRTLREAMRSLTGHKGFVSCRFSHVYPDGPAPYYTFLCAGQPDQALPIWAALKRLAGDVLERHGATITHHHAVGRVHRPWYERQRPELFAAAMQGAKAAVDPAGVMNPGVLWTAPGVPGGPPDGAR